MNNPRPHTTTLVVVVGPTAVGKTEIALQLAERMKSPVINCDSRQMFRGMEIGTASPTPEQLARVQHHFVDTLEIGDYYSAAQYEADVLKLIEQLAPTHQGLLLSGGSMMYVDAVCNGIDDIPTVDPHIRETLKQEFLSEGLEPLLGKLRVLDADYYQIVDHKNHKRVIHALEICLTSGKPYSSFRTNIKKDRPFQILKIGLDRPREELFARINLRVDEMMQQGLMDEALRLFPHRECNALNTVGYKELFHVISNEWPLEMAVERIKKNTRVYAKKQLTWFRRDPSINWFHPNELDRILDLVQSQVPFN